MEFRARSSLKERNSRETTACTRSVADSETTSRAPMRMPVGDVAFGNLRPHQQHRHLWRELIAHGGRLFRVGFGNVGADQQFGIQLLESFAEVADGGDPGAVHGFTGLAHQAVDELGRLTLRRENDERNGRIVRQCELPDGRAQARDAVQTSAGEFNTQPREPRLPTGTVGGAVRLRGFSYGGGFPG